MNCQFRKHPVERRQLAQRRETSPFHQEEAHVGDRQSDDDLIYKHPHDDLHQTFPLDGLVRPRLDFIPAQRCRLVRHVQERVYSAEQPVHDHRQYDASVHPQVQRILAEPIEYLVPLRLPEIARRAPEPLQVPETRRAYI